MSIWDKLKTTKDKVRGLMMVHPHLRDSDSRLVANIWNHELEKKGIKNLDGFFDAFVMDELTSYESIKRTRQKLQEQDASLRGKKYSYRQKEGEEIQYKIHDL